jgi:hypothetical protein
VVSYESRPVPGIDVFIEASKKRKMDATGKTPIKHVKVPMKKRDDSINIVMPQAKSSSK